jgi:hypothetical protein
MTVTLYLPREPARWLLTAAGLPRVPDPVPAWIRRVAIE